MADRPFASTMNAMAHVDPDKRKANRRLAILIGIVALGFYVLMLLLSL
jgi:hypothetical protein